MWIQHYRCRLPTLSDDTNNRVERSFWTLKSSIKNRFPSLPPNEISVIHLTTFCENHVNSATTQGTLKSLKINDADPQIRALNEEASLCLNERGCVLFHSSLKALQMRRSNLKVHSEGIKETYEQNHVKVYATTVSQCDYQTPCHHILLQHENENLPLLYPSLIHDRYLRKNSIYSKVEFREAETFYRVSTRIMPRKMSIQNPQMSDINTI